MARVLVVDDDLQYYEMMAEFLRAIGHEVALAVDPSQLAVIAGGYRPDAVILDSQMPQGGGPMAVKVLAETLGYDVPILFASGMPVLHQKRWYPEASNRRYIAKPLELREVEALLGELLLQRAPQPAASAKFAGY